jgi:hypothetical protein
MKMKNYFMDLYGEYDMSNSDIAQAVFKSGWNAALDEASKRANELPFGKDTQDSFAHWVKEIKND